VSLSADLCNRTLGRIVEVLSLSEAEPRPLTSPAFGPVGSQRVFGGDGISKLVYIGMTAAPIMLDSHMLFAFTPSGSAVPHFTLDSVQSGNPETGELFHAFHLDLVPRVDLMTDLDHIDAVFAPLTEAYEATQATEGLTPAHLSRRQWAVMSPWMLAHRATPEAFTAIGSTVDAYLDHWLKLVDSGPDGHDPDELAARDAAHRAILFDPDVDPVWAQVGRLLGDDVAETLRMSLADPDPSVR
jgi:hypothetical protein